MYWRLTYIWALSGSVSSIILGWFSDADKLFISYYIIIIRTKLKSHAHNKIVYLYMV